jgi:PAS domain S-box-containing protein
MNLFQNFRSSLALKFNSAILIASVIILLFMVALFKYLANETIDEHIKNELDYIHDALMIAVEASSETGMRRAVGILGARRSVEQISVINIRQQKIVASSDYAMINQFAAAALDPQQLRLLERSYLGASDNELLIVDGVNLHRLKKVSLIDPVVNRLRPFAIIVSYNKSQALANADRELRALLTVYALGVAVILIINYLLQDRILLRPIAEFIAIIRRRKDEPLPELGNDELTELARCYNQVNKARIEHDKQLSDARKYIDGLTKNNPVMLAYVDASRHYQFANAAFTDAFGTSEEEISGRYFFDDVEDDIDEQLSPWIEKVLSGQECKFEAELLFADGFKHTVNCRYTPDLNHDRSVAGFFICLEDITATKGIEKQLATYAQDLEFQTWAMEACPVLKYVDGFL